MLPDREALLHDAAAHLGRHPTASMDDIARAAGISRATLHRWFAGRDALVRGLEQLGISRVRAAVDAARLEEGDPGDALRRLIAEAESFAGFLGFLMSESQLFEPGAVDPGWTEADERIAALFRRGQETGVFRVELTAAFLTEALYALVTACAWAVQEGRVAERDAGPMTAELLLGGLLRRDAR
ncbi:TetR/AcrR family transcriptional regulator [Streptomyces sp. DSM 42041]|uniref:TetR/AcrR family transcriptional regulator n=1 Tax=Streptomyces hazeniae TaxID=3075538 RepID=A0ABU2NQ96_9ACTN|nr:TetR/AcrR family transcriptional regulator [Streptomyces sp. DSM 42041]MDT0379154.1 TetR/AcrR family transcriptional regulator [Streptomyces sp. DSM 42041]